MKINNRERAIKSIKLFADPVPATARAIEKYKLMEANDKVIKDWEKLHPVIDTFCRAALNYNLEQFDFDYKVFDEIRTSAKNKDEERALYYKVKKDLEKAVTNALSETKFHGLGKITNLKAASFVQTSLKEFVKDCNEFTPSEKAEYFNLIEAVNHLQGYGDKFLTTRITALKTWAAKRVCDNLEIYDLNRKNIATFLASDFADDFLKDFEEFACVTSMESYALFTTQGGIDYYNQMIGGVYNAEGSLIKKGYNQYVSELNAKNKADAGYYGPMFRLVTPLYKQILMPGKKAFVVTRPQNEAETRQLIQSVLDRVTKDLLMNMVYLVKDMDETGVYVHGHYIHAVSHVIFGNHETLVKLLKDEYINENQQAIEALSVDDSLDKKTKKSKEKELRRNIERASINDLDFTIAHLTKISNTPVKDKLFISMLGLCDALNEQLDLLRNSNYMNDNTVSCKKKSVRNRLAKTMYAFSDFNNGVRMLMDQTKDHLGDSAFYEDFNEIYVVLKNAIMDLNNANKYVTARPKEVASEVICAFGSSSKIVNKWFNNSTDDKFGSSSISIIRMPMEDGFLHYYFAELRPGEPKVKPFAVSILSDTDTEPAVELFMQQTSQDPIRILGDATFRDTGAKTYFDENPDAKEFVSTDRTVEPFVLTRDQYALYCKKKAKKSLTKEEETAYIDLMKRVCLTFARFANFDFDFKPTEQYKNFKDFCDHAATFMLTNSFAKVSRKQIEDLVERGDLLLFHINSRKLYKENTGKKNGYADFFINLFSNKNMDSNLIRLNSRPSLTFRPACVPKPEDPTHPAGSIVVNRTYKDGKKVPEHIQHEAWLYLNGKLEMPSDDVLEGLKSGRLVYHKTANDLQRDRRYTEGHYFIQLSYTTNNKVSGSELNPISEEVYEEAKKGCKTLSVIRGTKDLLFYCLYDENHNLIKSESLNVVQGIDYAEKLRVMSKERNEAKSMDLDHEKRVKSFKEAYLGFAITEIVNLAIEQKAVIVIEAIDEHYKNRMSAFDNQVYSTFDTGIEKRLASFHKKGVDFNEIGSFANPIQLASMNPRARGRKQNGILFRLNAAYTLCDPRTGFASLFNWNEYNGAKGRTAFISSFDSICFNSETGLYEAVFDYKNFKTKLNEDIKKLNKTKWKVYFGKPRTDYDRENKLYKYNEFPAQSLLDADFVDKDLSKVDLPPQMRDRLFDLMSRGFRENCVKESEENPSEYYTSVATKDDTYQSVSEVKAFNLARKLWFDLEREDEKGNYIVSWLNYVTKA